MVIVIVTNSDVVTLSVELFQLAGTGFYRSTHRSMGPPGKKDPEKKQQSSRRDNTELVLNGKKTILYYYLLFFFLWKEIKACVFPATSLRQITNSDLKHLMVKTPMSNHFNLITATLLFLTLAEEKAVSPNGVTSDVSQYYITHHQTKISAW